MVHVYFAVLRGKYFSQHTFSTNKTHPGVTFSHKRSLNRIIHTNQALISDQRSEDRGQRSEISNRTSEIGRQRKDNRAGSGINIYSLLEIIAGVGVAEVVSHYKGKPST